MPAKQPRGVSRPGDTPDASVPRALSGPAARLPSSRALPACTSLPGAAGPFSWGGLGLESGGLPLPRFRGSARLQEQTGEQSEAAPREQVGQLATIRSSMAGALGAQRNPELSVAIIGLKQRIGEFPQSPERGLATVGFWKLPFALKTLSSWS